MLTSVTMTLSSSTYLPLFFNQFILIRHIMKKITSKSFAKIFELKWSLVGQLSKLFVTLPFSINFRSKLKTWLSDYMLMRASSFIHWYLTFLIILFADWVQTVWEWSKTEDITSQCLGPWYVRREQFNWCYLYKIT